MSCCTFWQKVCAPTRCVAVGIIAKTASNNRFSLFSPHSAAKSASSTWHDGSKAKMLRAFAASTALSWSSFSAPDSMATLATDVLAIRVSPKKNSSNTCRVPFFTLAAGHNSSCSSFFAS